MGCPTCSTRSSRNVQLAAPSGICGACSTRYADISKAEPTPETEGSANTVAWEYPARGKMPPLKMFFYDGGIKPFRPPELDRSIAMPREGVLYVGDNGKLMASYYGGNPFAPFGRTPPAGTKVPGLPGGLLLPQSRFKDFPQPPKTLVRCERFDHYTEWTRCCKLGKPTVLPMEFACQLAELALLGTLAQRTGKLLEWDAEAMRVTNDPAPNQFIDPPYRAGWSL